MTTLHQNDRFLRALHRQSVDRTPVWLMRQAGRYLPEYQALRKQAGDFMTLCRTPELACAATLQPLARFDLDAAILFSDILTIPDAMGLGLSFSEGEGPQFSNPLRELSQIQQLPTLDPEVELRYVMDAVRLIKHELQGKIPLIGFSGSPWTLATYMIEGSSSKNFHLCKKMLYDEPETMHRLLSHLVTAITAYLNAQIAAGVDAVMIFDTWGGILTPSAYTQFSLQPMRDIIAGLQRERNGKRIPVILFSKQAHHALEAQANSGADALGLDWMIDIGQARQQVGHQVALQGNLDPAILTAQPKHIEQEVKRILDAYGPHPGHIFNLGHGITPDINPDHVTAMVDAVQRYGV